jgi:hypothetical protein
VVKVERGPETNDRDLTWSILRWIASKPRRNIHFEVFHVAQGDSNLAASVIIAVPIDALHFRKRSLRGVISDESGCDGYVTPIVTLTAFLGAFWRIEYPIKYLILLAISS